MHAQAFHRQRTNEAGHFRRSGEMRIGEKQNLLDIQIRADTGKDLARTGPHPVFMLIAHGIFTAFFWSTLRKCRQSRPGMHPRPAARLENFHSREKRALNGAEGFSAAFFEKNGTERIPLPSRLCLFLQSVQCPSCSACLSWMRKSSRSESLRRSSSSRASSRSSCAQRISRSISAALSCSSGMARSASTMS